MREVLLVTKPVGPPWDDGTLVIVRELVGSLTRWSPRVLGRRGDGWRPPQGTKEPIHGRRGGLLDSGRVDQARTLRRLLARGEEAIRHFVFAPTIATARAATVSRRARNRPVVQTVPSRPTTFDSGLVFGDLLVVTSAWAEERWVEDGGLSRLRIRRVPPPAPGPEGNRRSVAEVRRRHGLPTSAPLVLYPGDLDLGGADAATRTVEAFLAGAGSTEDAMLLMACRPKTPAAASLERSLRGRIARAGLEGRVRWLGRVPGFPDLVGATDLVVLPAVDTYGKVDLPIAVLEAMARGVAAIVPDEGPMSELAEDGSAVAVDAGSTDAVAAAMGELLSMDDQRRRVARAAARRASTLHGPAQVAERYEAIYDEVSG